MDNISLTNQEKHLKQGGIKPPWSAIVNAGYPLYGHGDNHYVQQPAFKGVSDIKNPGVAMVISNVRQVKLQHFCLPKRTRAAEKNLIPL